MPREYLSRARVFLTMRRNDMSRLKVLGAMVAGLALTAATTAHHTSDHRHTLAVTITNDAESNQIKVYDAESHVLLQTLSTHGKGGAGGIARGIKQFNGRVGVGVNKGARTVAT